MPFFDNTGVELDTERGPIWGAFATLRDQLERFVVLNLLWSAQLVPLLVAFMVPGLPLWVRGGLFLYSGVALAVMTGLLYFLVYAAVCGELLTPDLVWGRVAELAWSSMLVLVPLFGCFGVLWLVIGWATGTTLAVGYPVEVLARLLILLLLVCSLYWGPAWAAAHDAATPPTPGAIVRRSLWLAWRAPGRTLLLLLVVALIGGVGILSVGGIFLIVPVVVALLQTHMYVRVTR